MRVRRVCRVLCFGLLSACTRDAKNEETHSEREVTSALVTLPPIEGVTLPNGGEEPSVGMPAGVALLSGGRVALVDQFSLRLHVFDAAGQHLGSAGGKGEGPGQFQNVFGMASVGGDSIGVWDGTLRRLSIFTGDAKFVRVERMEFTDSMSVGRKLLGRFNDGRFVMLEQEHEHAQPDGRGEIKEQRRTIRAGSGRDAKSFALPPLRFVMAGGGNEFYMVGVPMNQTRRVVVCEMGLLVHINAEITAYDTGFQEVGRFPTRSDSFVVTGAERMRDIERNIGDKSRNPNWKRDRDMVDRLQPTTFVHRLGPTIDDTSRLWYGMRSAGTAMAMRRTTLAGTTLDTIAIRGRDIPYALGSSVFVGLQPELDTIEGAVRMYRVPDARRVQDRSPSMGRCNESAFF